MEHVNRKQERHHPPPERALAFLQWFADSFWLSELEGDLQESYNDWVEEFGLRRAKRKYWMEVLGFLRPHIIRKRPQSSLFVQSAMLKNYLIVALRRIRREKLYAGINVFGLAVGMAACLITFMFVEYELSFDGFHSKAASIYRLDEVQSFPGTAVQKVALSMPAMAPTLVDEYPEIESAVRVMSRGKYVYTVDGRQVFMDRRAYVDSTFLSFFDFELIAGDPKTALNDPFTMILDEQTAERLFGTTDVLGRQIVQDDTLAFQVTGVMKDFPENSHMQFETLISFATVIARNPETNTRWGSNYLTTYLQITPGTDIAALEATFPDYLIRHMGEEVTDYYKLFLQPLSDVHLGSADFIHDYINYKAFDYTVVWIFIALAAIVLSIAGINFMNLATARSVRRSHEVGLRKAIGANDGQVRKQFLGESVLFTAVSMALAVLIASAAIPWLNTAFGRDMSMMQLIESPEIGFGIIALTIVLGILAGSYPAFVVSRFTPMDVLKGTNSGLGGASFVRNGLIVFQFAIAFLMIAGTIQVYEQLQYLRTKDMGYDREHVMLIPMSNQAQKAYETIRNELLAQPGVTAVGAANNRFGADFHQWGSEIEINGERIEKSYTTVLIDYHFLNTYGIDLIEGRDFSLDFADDRNARSYIVNESLVKDAGWESAIGQRIGVGNTDTLGFVVGVVRDFNFTKLHKKVDPLLLHVRPEWGLSEISVRFSGSSTEQVIAGVEGTWNKLVSDRPFEYKFLDEHFADIYETDKQVSQVVSIISILAVIVACMGLFGLASLTTEHRIREIGIRKVLGASVSQITVLVGSYFFKLIVISFVFAVPLSVFMLREWLSTFAYHAGFNWMILVASAAVALAVAIISVASQTLKAARANPVQVLDQRN